MKKKIKALLLLGLVFLSGCGQTSAPSGSSAGTDSQSIDLFAMDTAMTLTAYGDHAGEALEAAKSEIERLDALFSISSESGDIYTLNRDHTAALHEDTRALLSDALEVSASTDGIFDCTIEPVMQAWGFTTQDYRVPTPAELSTLLAHVDYTQVQLDGSTAAIPDDADIQRKRRHERHHLARRQRAGARPQARRQPLARRGARPREQRGKLRRH